MHPRVADRPAFLALANGTEGGIRADLRFVTLTVAHVFGRGPTHASITRTRLGAVGYNLDAARVRLRVRGRPGGERGQAADRERHAGNNCKIPFHPSAFPDCRRRRMISPDDPMMGNG